MIKIFTYFYWHHSAGFAIVTTQSRWGETSQLGSVKTSAEKSVKRPCAGWARNHSCLTDSALTRSSYALFQYEIRLLNFPFAMHFLNMKIVSCHSRFLCTDFKWDLSRATLVSYALISNELLLVFPSYALFPDEICIVPLCTFLIWFLPRATFLGRFCGVFCEWVW